MLCSSDAFPIEEGVGQSRGSQSFLLALTQRGSDAATTTGNKCNNNSD